MIDRPCLDFGKTRVLGNFAQISFMYRLLIAAAVAILFSSCAEVAKKVNEEFEKSAVKADSLADLEDIDEEETTSDLSNDFKILKRKKEGEDSLFLVETYYKNKKKSAEMWYRWNQQDGLSVYYHKNGKVFYRVIWKENLVNTALEAYDTLGNALDAGNLKNGDGVMKYYDPKTCKITSEISYINSHKNGDYKVYFKSGELKEKGVFKNDKPEGLLLAYFKNGKLKEKGAFVDGHREGEHYIYYYSGKIKLYEKWKDRLLLKILEYDVRGNMTQEGNYSATDGLTETRYDYSPEGKMRSRCRFRNGMKNGLFEYYGDRYRRALEIWRNDTLLKEFAWYSNEQLKSIGVYRNNEKDSIYTEYYSTGKLRLQVGYKKGQRDGIYISYFDNGNKYIEGAYKDGKGAGKFKHYHKDGTYNGYYTLRDKEEPK
jgi:antitoxin component YwqK of YwqJK toxin-antitoxin module